MENNKFDSITFNIKRLNALLTRTFCNLNAIRSLDEQIGSSAFLLAYLYNHREFDISQKDIEIRFAITKGTLSKTLSLLEQKGYINRLLSESDHRYRYVSLTPLGEETYHNIQLEANKLQEELLKNFSEEDRKRFLVYLKKAMFNLENFNS